jgi:hypothetical protein
MLQWPVVISRDQVKSKITIKEVTMRIHSLLHESFEDSGYIRVWAEDNVHPFSETQLFSGEKLQILKNTIFSL